MKAISGILFLVMLGCGAIMTFWYFAALIDWLGVVFGILVGTFIIPGVIAFPLVFWLVEGVLPVQYLWTWLVGMISLVGVAIVRK